MLQAFSSSHRRITSLLLGASGVAALATAVIGLEGSVATNTLAFLAAIALVLALVHPWRRTREFKYLFYAAGLGFGALVVLHALLHVAADAVTNVPRLQAVVNGLGVVVFLTAVYVCPAAALVALGGADHVHPIAAQPSDTMTESDVPNTQPRSQHERL